MNTIQTRDLLMTAAYVTTMHYVFRKCAQLLERRNLSFSHLTENRHFQLILQS